MGNPSERASPFRWGGGGGFDRVLGGVYKWWDGEGAWGGQRAAEGVDWVDGFEGVAGVAEVVLYAGW